MTMRMTCWHPWRCRHYRRDRHRHPHGPLTGGTAGWGLEEGQTFDMMAQTIIQVKAVVVSIVWVAVATAITFAVMSIFGLKVKKEVEQEGLDHAEHGESAYHS